MRSIAYRRHTQNLCKNRAKKSNWFRGREMSPLQIGKLAATPTPCSCSMCGNPRNHYGNSHPYKISELRRMKEISYCETGLEV